MDGTDEQGVVRYRLTKAGSKPRNASLDLKALDFTANVRHVRRPLVSASAARDGEPSGIVPHDRTSESLDRLGVGIMLHVIRMSCAVSWPERSRGAS